jgi:hypothetical protein
MFGIVSALQASNEMCGGQHGPALALLASAQTITLRAFSPWICKDDLPNTTLCNRLGHRAHSHFDDARFGGLGAGHEYHGSDVFGVQHF